MRVAILCMNPWDAGGDYQPFSFAAYRIAAAVVASGRASEVRVIDGCNWTLQRWIDELEAFDPDVVGASTYVWSLPTFLELASRLKRNRPERTVVFGGPSARPAMLALEPHRHATQCVDALVIGPGEEAIVEILDARKNGTPLASLAGLALPSEGGFTETAPRPSTRDMNSLPSPYQLGLTPRGVTGQLETFRGCPMSCTFCQWGQLDSRTIVTSHEYLVAELRAMREREAPGVALVDAGLNLNTRAFRALASAEAEVGLLAATSFDCEIYPTLLTDEQVEFLGATHAKVGIGMQSEDPQLLRSLQRPFKMARFDSAVYRIARVAKAAVEIIVGLPGDTPEGFRRTFERASALPVTIRVYHCLVLPDALLTRAASDSNMVFDPVTLEMRSCKGWSEHDLRSTLDWLSNEAARRGGVHTRVYPRPATADDERVVFGRPVGSSLWIFPNEPVERWHNSGRRGPPPAGLVAPA